MGEHDTDVAEGPIAETGGVVEIGELLGLEQHAHAALAGAGTQREEIVGVEDGELVDGNERTSCRSDW